jgi:predicted CXXCH cytochrome family protein
VPSVVGVFAIAVTLGGGLPAAEHPTLVNVEDTDCGTCHEDLLEGREFVHAPVTDDCNACHEFTKTDAGMQVGLMEADPPLCVICHSELSGAVEAELSTPHYPVTDSCLTCHEPHASDERRLLRAVPGELCSSCHDRKDIGEAHYGQLTATTDCSSCHSPHGSENDRMLSGNRLHQPFAEGSCAGCHREVFGDRIRLRARGKRLCTSCHGGMTAAADEGGVVHAALEDARGRAGCLNCHDPHMSDQRTLLLRDAAELCATCHEPVVKATKGPNGHPPAEEDCLNCHQPHASAGESLLSAEPGELCRLCHDVEDEQLVGAHLGAPLERLECLACHTPHGGEHQKLLASNLHAPLLDGCETCHEGSHDQLMEDGESSLCLICHDDIGEAASQAQVPHAALELGRCTDCHNPHASPQKKLVKQPGGQVCAECHEEQAPAGNEVAHGVIDLIGCQACHEPHGGEKAKLLRDDVEPLCRSCHDESQVEVPTDGSDAVLLGRFTVPRELVQGMASLKLTRDGQHGHPVPGHRVSGTPSESELHGVETTFTGALTCLTCHDPHKGRSAAILQWNTKSPVDACLNCHPK